jgi:hypothetical protein
VRAFSKEGRRECDASDVIDGLRVSGALVSNDGLRNCGASASPDGRLKCNGSVGRGLGGDGDDEVRESPGGVVGLTIPYSASASGGAPEEPRSGGTSKAILELGLMRDDARRGETPG